MDTPRVLSREEALSIVRRYKVSFLIEPVLMAEDRWSPLYDDVMQIGITF
ncbi:MAG: hypothetical protein J1F40_05510 [Prevotellaceae bacterium]|nr:hypothetical protein [Prevotellaceae bacterium]